MATKLCDICGVRPAAIRVTLVRNGAREELDVCEYDYAQLTRHQKYLSPLESLFGGDPFSGFFDRAGNIPEQPSSSPAGLRGAASPDSSGGRGYIQRFSEQAKEEGTEKQRREGRPDE